MLREDDSLGTLRHPLFPPTSPTQTDTETHLLKAQHGSDRSPVALLLEQPKASSSWRSTQRWSGLTPQRHHVSEGKDGLATYQAICCKATHSV